MNIESEYLLVIDPGHGDSDPGAVGLHGMLEKHINLFVALTIYRKSKAKGFPFEVRLTRHDDVFLGLKERADLANKWKAAAYISVHCNSANTPAKGIETFCARGSTKGYQLAEAIQESSMATFPNHSDRGVKRANYTVLTKTKMPAALHEIEFMHTQYGHDFLDNKNNLIKSAEAIITGAAQFFGLESLPQPEDSSEPVPHAACEISEEIAYHALQILELSRQ